MRQLTPSLLLQKRVLTLLYLTFSIFSMFFNCDVTRGDELTGKQVVSRVKNLCDALVKTKLDRAKFEDAENWKHKEIAAWGELTVAMHADFLNEMHKCAEFSDLFIRQYLQEALERPGQEGFRLLLAAEGVLFSVQSVARIQPRGDVWVACSRASAEHQLALMSTNTPKRAALFQFLMWRGRNTNRVLFFTSAQTTIQELKKHEDTAWYARNFAVFAMATGREDLVSGLTVENVDFRAATWSRWLGHEVHTLRPSTVGWFWYAAPNADRVNRQAPWDTDLPKLPALIVVPPTPLPNWEGPVLPLKGSEYLDHS